MECRSCGLRTGTSLTVLDIVVCAARNVARVFTGSEIRDDLPGNSAVSAIGRGFKGWLGYLEDDSQSKLKGCAGTVVRHRPEPSAVTFDNGTTD
jgi:hypothetical protein